MRQHAVLGYCGTNRTADVAAKGASCVSTYGRWYTPGTKPSLQECARGCAACDSCQFVSFSAQTVDCSLYAACDVSHLTRVHGYMTLDVRQLSASDLLESPSPPILRASAANQQFGRWHYNVSAGYPYLLDDDNVWAPRCSAMQRSYLKDSSAVPGWVRMQWTPPDGQRCARADLCEALSGKTLALIGDSVMMQMVHAMQGFFLPERRVNLGYSPYNLTICSGRASLLWLRSNAYNRKASRQVLRDADVVIANWGLWDSGDISDQKHHQNLEELQSDVETLLLQKSGARFFWRATIAAHGWCDADVLEDVPLTKNPLWRAGELMARDREVDQPMFRSRPGMSVLHIDRLHMPFGHRVYLGKSATRMMSDSADSGVHDCLHYCEPGVPDAWIELFCWQMRDSGPHD